MTIAEKVIHFRRFFKDQEYFAEQACVWDQDIGKVRESCMNSLVVFHKNPILMVQFILSCSIPFKWACHSNLCCLGFIIHITTQILPSRLLSRNNKHYYSAHSLFHFIVAYCCVPYAINHITFVRIVPPKTAHQIIISNNSAEIV